jgi:Protein of unknown function (DUF2800)
MTLTASSLHLWGPSRCPASAAMIERHKNDEVTEARREGTAAHEVVTALLSNGEVLPLGALTKVGVPVDPDMIDGAELLVESVMRVCRNELAYQVERKIDLGPEVAPGYADVVVFDDVNKAVHVWEYKYGHRHVDAIENYQLLAYANGLIGERDGWKATLYVVQPRSFSVGGSVREWSVTSERLLKYAREIESAVHMAQSTPHLQITGDHCVLCPGKTECETFLRVGDNAIDLSSYADPIDLSAAAVGKMLKVRTAALLRLKSQVEGLEEQALRLICEGGDVPYWTTGFTSPRESWNDTPDNVIAFGDNMGIDLRKAATAITPAQARKAGLPKGVVDSLASRPPGAMKLVPFDPRDAARRLEEGSTS